MIPTHDLFFKIILAVPFQLPPQVLLLLLQGLHHQTRKQRGKDEFWFVWLRYFLTSHLRHQTRKQRSNTWMMICLFVCLTNIFDFLKFFLVLYHQILQKDNLFTLFLFFEILMSILLIELLIKHGSKEVKIICLILFEIPFVYPIIIIITIIIKQGS